MNKTHRPPTPAPDRPRSGRREIWIPLTVLPTVLAAVLCVAYLIVEPRSIDLAAAEYRAQLFGRTGFALWDLQWYGGHYLPAYSVLVPACSWLLGTQWLGALSVISATALFQRLIRARDARPVTAAAWFGVGVFASLLSGRVTFTAGIPVALATLLVERSGWPASGPSRRRTVGRATAVLGLSAATALFSPVASLFLAVAWAALLLTRRERFFLGALLATFAPIIALNLAFPETGVEPLALTTLIPLAVVSAAMLAAARGRRDAVAAGLAVYLVACTLTAVLHTPVGGNVLRLGPLLAGPLLLLWVRPRRRLVLALVVPALAYWQCADAIRDVRVTVGSPTTHAAYYAPLLRYLNHASSPGNVAADGGFRVEIPFTRLHWEARWVAPSYPLARGWERQVDVADNGLFYRPGLTAAGYDRWLHDDAVRFVALPDTSLDASAVAERRIIASRPRFLVPVWSDRDWRIYRVRDPVAIVDGGRLLSLTSDSIAVSLPADGRSLLRIGWNPYWVLAGGSGCVSPAGRWTRIRGPREETVRLDERFSLDRLGSRAPRCTR